MSSRTHRRLAAIADLIEQRTVDRALSSSVLDGIDLTRLTIDELNAIEAAARVFDHLRERRPLPAEAQALMIRAQQIFLEVEQDERNAAIERRLQPTVRMPLGAA